MSKGARLLLVAGIAAAILAACAKPTPAIDTAKEAAAINAEIAAINAASRAKDADKAVAFDADDFTGWDGGPTVKRKADDLAAYKALMADPNFTCVLSVDHTEVAKSDDLAYQTGSYMVTYTN